MSRNADHVASHVLRHVHRGRSGPTIAPLTPMSAVAKALSRRSSNAASVSSRSSEKHPLTVPAVSDSMPHMMLAPKVIKSRCVASGCTTGLDKATSSSNNSRSHRKPFPLEDCCGVKECHLQSGKAMFSLLRTTVRDHIGISAHGTGDPGSSDRLRTRTQSHRGELLVHSWSRRRRHDFNPNVRSRDLDIRERP